MGRKNTTLPRGLSRVDHTSSGVHLWRVQSPDGSYIYFGDVKFGSKEAALHAALACLARADFIAMLEGEELLKRNRHIRKLLTRLEARSR